MGAQVALAGYADLPTAAAFTLGALAGARAARTRAPVDALAATLALAAAASMKTSGWVWVVIALPGLAAAALGPAWTRRIAIAIPALAVGVVAVGARFTDLSIGPVSLAFDPVFAALGTDGVLLANWHLLALGAVGTIVFARRRLLDPAVAPLTLVVAAGAAWIGLLGAFPWLRNWGADSLGLNRVVLALAPVVSIWMVVALHAARTPQRQPAVEPMGA